MSYPSSDTADSFWCLTCVKCTSNWCTYRGVSLFHSGVEALVVIFCIYEVLTLFKHQVRRSLYMLFGLQAACLSIANFITLQNAQLGLVALAMNYMVPLTAISADTVMISYWVKTFYSHREGYVQTVNTITFICNFFLYSFSAVFTLLHMQNFLPDPSTLFFVLGGALVVMSICCLTFVIAFSRTLSNYECFLPFGALKPLRWTLWAAAMSCISYLIRSVVILSYGVGKTWVHHVLADPRWCSLYSLLLIFLPSWVCVLAFSSWFMKLANSKWPMDQPQYGGPRSAQCLTRDTSYLQGLRHSPLPPSSSSSFV
uniref:Uncharacterized protein n=1 Tax=Eutreptiella gymnastica TaxID=73025 RepID=A0A7S1IXM2_9EUGL|mmetsp:Transcript_51304/g.91693  ORF Transcript_51304/g.91693 Transcript_51304/m.91693 type:complete len:313 (+) Transcript_51304:52-990(+)